MMGRTRKHRKDLPQRVYLNHGSYFFVDKNNKWHNLGKDLATALVKYVGFNHSPAVINNMATIMDRYQIEVIPTKSPRTQKDNLSELANLRRTFGQMAPGEITAQHIYQYMDARGAKTRANREKSLLSNIFTYCIRWGVVTSNPCRDVTAYKENARTRYVTDEEFEQVLALASPVIRAAMLLSVTTGLRLGDVLALKRSAITDRGLLVVTNKTGRKLLFLWSDGLRAAVDAAKAASSKVSGTSLLSNRYGKQYTPSGFKSMWQRVRNKAVESGMESFTFHDIRAKAGSDAEDKKLLGHTDQKTFNRHYQRAPVEVTPLK